RSAFGLPEIATLAVLFILYSNAAVVAVRFHAVPESVSTALPVLLFLPLASYLIIQRQKLIFNPVLGPIILFLGVQIVSTVFSANVVTSSRNLNNFLIEGLGIYFLLTNVIRTPEMLRRSIWALLIAGAFLGGLSVYQQVTQTYDNNYWGFAQMSSAAFGTGAEDLYGEVLQRRLAGPLGDQNRYAQVMLMLVPLGLFRFWGERSKPLRILALIATILATMGAALTFSRGAAVGFVLMLVVTALMGYIKPHQLVITFVGLFLLLQALPQYGARLSSLEDVSNALTGEGSNIRSADGSTQSRVTEMLAAAMVFVDHPIVGVGPGMYRFYYQDYAEQVGIRVLAANRQAHNLYLGLAAETGALGLITFGACVVVTLNHLALVRRRLKDTRPDLANLASGMILVIITYLTTGLFLHFAYIRFFWLMMALAGAAAYVAQASAAPTGEGKLEGK
ncbi:MAG: O-antigen ligase family protein, partial [Anaerolineales bacterium]